MFRALEGFLTVDEKLISKNKQSTTISKNLGGF